MTDRRPSQDRRPRAVPLEDLVGSWLTVPDIAERLGIPLSAVRRLIEDRELLSARIGERTGRRRARAVPRRGGAPPPARAPSPCSPTAACATRRSCAGCSPPTRRCRSPARRSTPGGRVQDRGAPPGHGAGLLADPCVCRVRTRAVTGAARRATPVATACPAAPGRLARVSATRAGRDCRSAGRARRPAPASRPARRLQRHPGRSRRAGRSRPRPRRPRPRPR